MMNIMIKICGQVKQESVAIKSKVNPHSIRASYTKFTIKKVENYENILKLMTSPFSESLIPEQQVMETINRMKTGNRVVYEGLVQNMHP